VTAFARSNFSV
jgi:DNA-directed RNA polymerase I and III subunit RPAC1